MTAVVEHLSNLIRIASNSAVSNRPVVEYAAEVLHSVGWTTRALEQLIANLDLDRGLGPGRVAIAPLGVGREGHQLEGRLVARL